MALLASVDLASVPLFDGTRSDSLNTWGGDWGIGQLPGVGVRMQVLPSGRRAVRIEFDRVAAEEQRYLQCFASGFGPGAGYYQTRDLTRYERITITLQNATRVAVRSTIQLKDYRDTTDHCATYRFDIPASPDSQRTDVPLPASRVGWVTHGAPDLRRILTLDFIFEPLGAIEGGHLLLTDLNLEEQGGPLDVDTSPLPALVERLAQRQWDALWASRSREHGMIPNTSYQATDAGLNTTAAVVWMLPSATRRHWVERVDADRYIESLLHTIDRLQDRAKHLPPRFVDWVTLRPSLLPEESAIDAAFLTLALHQYKSLPSTPQALRRALEEVQDRFDFAAFACPTGWRMAYRHASAFGPEGFTPCTYDGYTNESNLTSLAAHLVSSHHVPIERHWNASANRIRLGEAGPVVHSRDEFRAPFTQALWNLFVDVRERGIDCFPDGRLAVNPWQNFVCYEQNVLRRLADLGRTHLVQPDAGDDGTLNCYRQFSVYDDFGNRDLFMPWSVSLALLAGADHAGESLRFLLRHRLHGPFGLADSAKWATGAAEPYAVTARHDLWNTSLATMALLEWLDGPDRLSKAFAALPEVRAALDRVFVSAPATTELAPGR